MCCRSGAMNSCCSLLFQAVAKAKFEINRAFAGLPKWPNGGRCNRLVNSSQVRILHPVLNEKRDMSWKKQGDIGEMTAALYYTKQGYEVFYPLTEATRVDLIVMKGSNLVRVQCKTSTSKQPSGSYQVGLATGGGNQSWNGKKNPISKDEVDEVFIWCGNESIWIVPAEDIDGKSTFTAGYCNVKYHVQGPKPTEYKVPQPQAGAKKAESVRKFSRCEVCQEDTGSSDRKYCDEHRPNPIRNLPESKTKIDWPDDETLKSMLNESNYSQVGLKLGVSDNAIRKRLNRKETK